MRSPCLSHLLHVGVARHFLGHGLSTFSNSNFLVFFSHRECHIIWIHGMTWLGSGILSSCLAS